MTETRIGVFDSGLGGLSIAKSIVDLLPEVPLVYLADSAHRPYGEKSQHRILERSRCMTQALLSRGCNLIVVACNTATVNTINRLRQEFPVSFVGVEPGIKPGLLHSKNKNIGVLTTARTAKSQRFQTFCQQFSDQGNILVQPCPGLMEQVEQLDITSANTIEMLRHYLHPLLSQGIDTLVLGCTHYPFLQHTIQQLVGPKINLINTSDAVARQVSRLLGKENVETDSIDLAEKNSPLKSRRTEFYTTGKTHLVSQPMANLWGEEIVLNELIED